MHAYYFVGWLVFIAAFLIAQTRFYDAHQRTHGQWRAHGRWHSTPRLYYNLTEIRAMLRATFRRDDHQTVETARRIYLLVLAIGIAYLIAGPGIFG